MDFEKADVVGRWLNFNFYPLFPKYDYNTKELIKPWESIYRKWNLLQYISDNFREKRKIKGNKFTFNLLPLWKKKRSTRLTLA